MNTIYIYIYIHIMFNVEKKTKKNPKRTVPDTSNTSETRRTRVRHKWKTLILITTQVKIIDFDNETRVNIFSDPYISHTANERPQGEEQFHSRNYLLEMLHSHAKIHLKSAPEKLTFEMAKAISEGYTLDCRLQMFLHVPA